MEQFQFSERTKAIKPSFIREILKLTVQPNMISFAGGLPDPAFFPTRELERCASSVFQKKGMIALQYSETEGYYPLRQYVAERYHKLHGISIAPEQVLITSGSQQALDLIGKLFLNPGDGLLLERPSYLGAIQAFTIYQSTFTEVDLLRDGIDTDKLAHLISENLYKLFYAIPNFQNPTGVQYTLQKRTEMADILSRTNTWLVEDDPYGELYFEGSSMPPVYKYLPDQTILLGSFSKTISPGLRLGWAVANREVIKKLAILKQSSDLHSGSLSQLILHEYLNSYDLEQHLREIRMSYRRRRDIMVDALYQYFPFETEFNKPAGGMFAWVSLPPRITAREFLQQAITRNIVFVPGDPFYISRANTQTLRLNFSNVEESKMQEAVKILGKLITG